jgi:hypothetical protein
MGSSAGYGASPKYQVSGVSASPQRYGQSLPGTMMGGGASSHHTPGSPGPNAAYIPQSPVYNPASAYQGGSIPGVSGMGGVGRPPAYLGGSPIDSSPSHTPVGDPNPAHRPSPIDDSDDAAGDKK